MLKGKIFAYISHLSNNKLAGLIDYSIEIKSALRKENDVASFKKPLKYNSISMIFKKKSTRSRFSTETGIFKLGGHAQLAQLGNNLFEDQNENYVFQEQDDIVVLKKEKT